MASERDEALEEFLTAFDRRLEAAPLIDRRDRADRRARQGRKPIDGRRSDGPASDPFAYWDSAEKPGDTD